MDIYIVVSDSEDYHENYPDGTFHSFDKDYLTLERAIEVTKGDVSVGGSNKIFKLRKIVSKKLAITIPRNGEI